MRSMSEADEIFVLDTGSQDNTVQLLREAGAKVWEEKIVPWRFDVARNRSLELVPEDTDICVCTDLDEVFHPGWRKILETHWVPGTQQASYRYTWNFNADGSEGHVFWIDNIHARHGFEWRHPVHEVITWMEKGSSPRRISIEGIQLDHHADPQKSRSQYLPLLEMSVREDPTDDRNMHYLGREYMFWGRWDDCIMTLKRHLAMPKATWPDERCASMRYIARCYERKGDKKSAEAWYWRAIAEAPHLREPFMDLARLFYEQKDWEGVRFLTGRALAIAQRPQTYICESESWGSLPWDLSALALFYTGQKREALAAAEQALQISPDNARLQENVRRIRLALGEAPEDAMQSKSKTV